MLLLNEPDAHLHLILQDSIHYKLRAAAARRNSQLIVATHSEVVVNAVEPRELCEMFHEPRMLADDEERSRLISSPFEEPQEHWRISEYGPPERREGRRPAMYLYQRPGREPPPDEQAAGTTIELKLVNRIRAQLARWRPLALRGEGGVSRTTMELMRYWRREGREHRLFFAQLEAAETILFLTEARADFLQGIDIPLDEPGMEGKADGMRAFRRYAGKMATGTGKTTVMAMLAAWSILNKVSDRGDARYSDVVLVVCPNVTIRSRLEELKPQGGEASLYRTRDLVPAHLMPSSPAGTCWSRTGTCSSRRLHRPPASRRRSSGPGARSALARPSASARRRRPPTGRAIRPSRTSSGRRPSG